MLMLLLAGTVSFSVGLWFYSTMEELTAFEYATAIAVAIVVIFSVIIGMRRIKDEKKGLAVEDELSNQIKQKAAASAFTFSFYFWVMVLIFFVDADIPARYVVYVGILGQGLLFIAFWIYYSRVGISDANKN